MKILIMSLVFLVGMGCGVFLLAYLEVKAEDKMMPASMAKMVCEKYADIPLNNNKIYRCENSEIICYITAPEAQMQCKFL